jgi:hypothetical protein
MDSKTRLQEMMILLYQAPRAQLFVRNSGRSTTAASVGAGGFSNFEARGRKVLLRLCIVRTQATKLFSLLGLTLAERGHSPFRQNLLRVEPPEHFDQPPDQTGPPGLMACADAGAVIAVEILVEENMVAPMGVGLELVLAAIDRPAPVLIAHEKFGQPGDDLLRDLEEIHLMA